MRFLHARNTWYCAIRMPSDHRTLNGSIYFLNMRPKRANRPRPQTGNSTLSPAALNSGIEGFRPDPLVRLKSKRFSFSAEEQDGFVPAEQSPDATISQCIQEPVSKECAMVSAKKNKRMHTGKVAKRMITMITRVMALSLDIPDNSGRVLHHTSGLGSNGIQSSQSI
ncbi:hypothetical protein BDV32DRAFT_116288 [Aspergillus pseudonomiae]|nr:hypothetical protein BDV32DRAFT_116288 [Aspergillus pseudonomiae]